jgi:NAD-dependent SIR2 family protein deacetylase
MQLNPKILILGAGCSRNYTEGYNKALKPPLDSDFFQIARKVLLQNGAEYSTTSFQEIIDDIHRLYGYPEYNTYRPWLNTPDAAEYTKVLDDRRLSLEKVMTQLTLEREIFDRTPTVLGYPRQNAVDYSGGSLAALIELIAVTIYEALKGPPCSSHLKLARSLVPGDAILTFNYDLLMDNVLTNTGKLSDSGYMIGFQKSLDYDAWMRPEEVTSEVALLKLHGSMNWLHCSICNAYLLTRSKKIGPWNLSIPDQCPSCGEKDGCLERMIVPPVLAKDYTSQPLRALWNHAHRYIERTREIVIIGYSFPPTDFATESLLRTSLPWANQRKVHFTIVNPEKKVFRRFKKMFKLSAVDWNGSLEEYLSTI